MSMLTKELREEVEFAIQEMYHIEKPHLDEMLLAWEDAKEDFYHSFGDKYIIESAEPVTVELSDAQKEIHFNDFLNRLLNGYSTIYNKELVLFLREQGWKAFYKNKVFITTKTSRGEEIPIGMKLIKAFKYFYNDNEKLRRAQDQASVLIQEQHLTGKLCLSIHPLDYLTMSTNQHNWSSCHHYLGDYAAGNFGYIMDGSTVVAYIKADEKYNLARDFVWNSKKWRQLLYFSEDTTLIAFSRQYPFSVDIKIQQKIIEMLNEITEIPWGSPIAEPIITVPEGFTPLCEKYIPLHGCLKTIKDIMSNQGFAYNDLLENNSTPLILSYRYDLTYQDYNTSHWRTTFSTGSPYVPCLQCGQNKINHGYLPHCDACEIEYGQADNDDFGFCDCCGKHEFTDALWYLDDYTYCADCWETHVVECDRCGGLERKEDLYLIKDTEGNQKYVCEDCLEETYEIIQKGKE